MTELKNCPFCGSRVTEWESATDNQYIGRFIECLGCGIRVFHPQFLRSELEGLWNLRKEPKNG